MFRLLLDEHILPKLAEQIRAEVPGAEVESLHFWRGGRLLHQPDARILREALEAGWSLRTFDLATIPAHLAELAAAGAAHHGVIFVSAKFFAQNDHGGLVRAIAAMWPAGVIATGETGRSFCGGQGSGDQPFEDIAF